ncbi:unnamed protein product, partial [Meganyctiphanes norvegica]
MKSRLLIIVSLALGSFAEPKAHVYRSGLLIPSTVVPSVQKTSPSIWFSLKTEQQTKTLDRLSANVTNAEKIKSKLKKETPSKSRTTPPMNLFHTRNSRGSFSNLNNNPNFSSSRISQNKANLGNIKWQSNKNTNSNRNYSQSENENIFSNKRTNNSTLNGNSRQSLRSPVLRSFPVNSFQDLKLEPTISTSNRKHNNIKTLSKIVLKKTLHSSSKTAGDEAKVSSSGVNRTTSSEPWSVEVHGSKHPELLSELREIIRHQRQIRFKSSYQDLPVSLQAAAN